MTMLRKKGFVVLIAFVLVFITLGISFGLPKDAIAASGRTYFSAEKYTDSDNLLLPNGTEILQPQHREK